MFAKLALLMAVSVLSGCTQKGKPTVNWFIGKDEALQAPLDADDVAGLHAALQKGANVNAKGVHGVTPLEYAIGHFGKKTYMELLRLQANPNQRDDEQDNALTLAVRAYAKDPSYLVAAIQAGGDPNTRGPDNNPLIATFKQQHNLEGIKALHGLGAAIDVRTRNSRPLIIDAGLTEDWDVVWLLLQLGAQYNYPEEVMTLADCFMTPEVTPPDSPLYKDKVLAWNFLKSHGMELPPINVQPR
jgi:ankyrin repeat protein